MAIRFREIEEGERFVITGDHLMFFHREAVLDASEPHEVVFNAIDEDGNGHMIAGDTYVMRLSEIRYGYQPPQGVPWRPQDQLMPAPASFGVEAEPDAWVSTAVPTNPSQLLPAPRSSLLGWALICGYVGILTLLVVGYIIFT